MDFGPQSPVSHLRNGARLNLKLGASIIDPAQLWYSSVYSDSHKLGLIEILKTNRENVLNHQ